MARKQKMKVYHGIPKSITDEHTILYASFDGVITPEIGSTSFNSSINYQFHPYITGLGLKTSTPELFTHHSIKCDVITCDFYADFTILNSASNSVPYFKISIGNLFYRVEKSGSSIVFASSTMQNPSSFAVSKLISLPLTTITTYNHYRVVMNSRTGEVTTYINGKTIGTNSLAFNFSSNVLDIANKMQFAPSKGQLVSDFHVSNIDRGDYFPNLPQDFIEGKAVIKPRMGQQQIKGDPMYSQVTTLRVVSPTKENEHLYYDLVNKNQDGLLSVNSLCTPELAVTNAFNWESGAGRIIIRGLNGEIIGGVIDTDTALAKVVSYSANTKKVIVDDVSKLSEGDTVQFLNSDLVPSNSARTINEINGNELTLHAELTVSNAKYLIETTASSSSPKVKLKNGTEVKGTWSGLGTSKATFTVGNNTVTLKGQDLYVEYSLTMPYGNSDFPEIPHTVERAWGENEVEMKPVSEVVIIDDFKGKLAGRNKECPHKIYQCLMSSLQSPNNISSNIASGFEEISSQSNISNIVTLNDNKLCTTGVTSTNKIPQQLFSFNLIEMVERKLGCEIPSINKVQWLKENYDYVKVMYNGYGTNPTGNLVKVTIFDHSTNLWLGDWLSITTSSPSTKNGAFRGADNFNRITPNGILYVLAHTNPSDGVTTSGIHTDYISVEISLKMDSAFTTLYCDNKRAREDKCNPVLIQKETKTVKRYLPSKECFTTECKYVDMPRSILPTSDLFNYHHKGTKVYSTTRGSGMYSQFTGIYPNIINLLKIADYNAHTYLNDGLKDNPVTAKFFMSFTEQLGESVFDNNLSGMPTESYDLPKYIQIIPYIRLNKGELELMLCTSEIVNNTDNALHPKKMTKEHILAYKLPCRPLIK